MKARLSGCLVSALRLLTVLAIPGRDCRHAEDALYAFPLVGALLGGILAAGTFLPLPPLPLAVLLLIVQTLLTGGLHLDGLADTVDGFGGGATGERALAIMKDSRIGVFGALALVLGCLLKCALLQSLLAADAAAVPVLSAMMVARTALVFQCVIWPVARPGGTGSTWIGKARPTHLVTAIVICASLLAALGGATPLILLPVGIVVAWLWGHYARHRVGGMTGDLLGATNEIVEIACLAVWLTAR